MASDDKKNVIPSGARERVDGWYAARYSCRPPTPLPRYARNDSAEGQQWRPMTKRMSSRAERGNVWTGGTLHDIRAAHPHRFLATLGMTAPKDSNGVR